MSKPVPPPLDEVVKTSARYAARTRDGLRDGLRDARTATLRAPLPEEHARRILFGFTAPLTVLRLAWANVPFRRVFAGRLLPSLMLVALVTGIGVSDVVTALLRERRAPTARAAPVRAEADDDDGDGDGGGDGDGDEEIARGGRATPPPPARPPQPTGRMAAVQLATKLVKSKVAKLLAVLGVLEWILVWIGREYHDATSYALATLTGVPNEPAPRRPRLRLDFGWLKTKAWRALRFLLFLGLAAPLTGLLGNVPRVGDALGVVAQAAWFAYWGSVFAIANTFVAWAAPLPEGWTPWFIRALHALGRVPVLGLLPRLYARLLTLATRGVWPACRAFERAPWEAAGLALARGVASVPMLYLVARPLLGPAATHALLTRTTPWAAPASFPPGPPLPPPDPPVPPPGPPLPPTAAV